MVVGEIIQEKDVMIIGGGPGGYHAAIRAAQLGLTVTLVEKKTLGGACLNQGCIPSKVFTHAAKQWSQLTNLPKLGIKVENQTIELPTLLAYQKKMIDQLRHGVEALCKANKIEVIEGSAAFLSEDRIGIENGHAFDTFRFKHAIIATGSTVNGTEYDSPFVLAADELYSLNQLPPYLLVYGHDYIAIEAAMSMSAFGSKVVFVQDAPFPFDHDISHELKRQFKKKGIKWFQESALIDIHSNDKGVQAKFKTEEQETFSLECTHFLMEGRRNPNTKEMGLERIGIELDENGFIITNHRLETSLPHIYAVGDVTEGALLASKALKQGKQAAEAIAGMQTAFSLSFIPNVVHSLPPIASVGLTEQQGIDSGYSVIASRFPLATNGMAAVMGESSGFIKVIADQKTDLILGLHMIGHGAIELSSAFVQTLEMVAKTTDLQDIFYAHPSLNETLLECIEGLTGTAIHMVPKKQSVK
ncbi:dihydrolipoyl dehydrogenase [Bacillus sp. 1P06AnD]|uniref:dihydrolipoyl dehydrogenase n=1 Tax=Bacillus sp. 1P06AnD TaxID=3132208 RepID=UPI00399FFC8A